MRETEGQEQQPTTPLSRRELDVLEMTAQGMTNSEVGQCLDVSVHAVKFHLASIYRKLNVGNRTEAAVMYLRLTAQAEGPPRSNGESWT